MPEITEDRLRQIIREELMLIFGGGEPVQPDDPDAKCTATKGNLVCTKNVHRGRHLFRSRPREAPPSKWSVIPEVKIPGTGSRSHIVRAGSPCKVRGLGKGGGAQPGWTISKIEQSSEDPADINVTVDRRGKNTRTVKVEKIVYVRPK